LVEKPRPKTLSKNAHKKMKPYAIRSTDIVLAAKGERVRDSPELLGLTVSVGRVVADISEIPFSGSRRSPCLGRSGGRLFADTFIVV
jgi:hypothetical protein